MPIELHVLPGAASRSGFLPCTISRAEWDANSGKLDPTFNPTLQTMDRDNSNSIDQDEWAAAEGQKTAIGNNCREATSSWCPCQNNPDKPECQK